MRKEKLTQLIQLARQLVFSAEGMTLDEMADFLHVSRRTADRTRASLEEIFPQLETLKDGQKVRFRLPGGVDRFLNAPTADELVELHNSVNSLRQHGAQGRADLLSSLQDKIQSSLRQRERIRLAPDINALVIAEGDAMQVGPRPTADRKLLGLIREALKGGNRVRFTYTSSSGTKERIVSPWGLLYAKAYYLIGPVDGAENPVLWRLDRLHALQLERGMGFLPPEGWSLQEFASRSFGVWQNRQYKVALRFSAAAAKDAKQFLFHPTQRLTEEEEGTLHVTFTASGLREMAYHFFSWGPEVTIIAPTELREMLLEMCRDVMASYGEEQ